jgi:hypothetical protein
MSNPGNPLVNQPPTDVTVKDVVDHEIDPRKRAQLEALGRKDAGEHNTIWGGLWASIYDGLGYLVNEFASSLDEVLAYVGKFFRIAQGEKNPAFYDLSAAILEDLTGVEVNAESLKQSAFGSGRLAAMEQFGGDLYKLLEEEFKPASGDLEAGDVAPAQRFLGFLMNFAIRQGNIECLTGFLPEEFRVGEGFRAYGELMAKNLGLGRLARQALRPLIQTLVADPLLYKLQEQYRPKRIGSSPAIKKFFRDPSFEQQMRKELAQEGFTNARIDDLVSDLRPLLAERQLIEYFFRFGDVTTSIGDSASLDTKSLIQQRGFSAEDAQKLIDVSRPVLDKGEIGTLFANEKIDQPTALGYLTKLGFDSDTAMLVLRAHSLQHQHARRLGLAELKKAFHNAVIDLLELKAHLSTDGYSDDDIQIITLDLLQPTHGKTRQLSLAEVKAGFKAGILTEQQAAEHLKTLGYSDADIAVLVKTLPGPKATAPASTPASSAPGTPAGG